MKLYQSYFSPNSRRVRIFLAEKSLQVPCTEIDLLKGQSHTSEYLKINPMGEVPALVMDDGTSIAESVAICRYFEMFQPEPCLFGSSAKESAVIEMWLRRIELKWFIPLTQYWLHTAPMWSHRVEQISRLAEQNRASMEQFLIWLDSEMAERDFIAGERYSMADIIAQTTMDHANSPYVCLEVSHDLKNLSRWHDRVSTRPSAKA